MSSYQRTSCTSVDPDRLKPSVVCSVRPLSGRNRNALYGCAARRRLRPRVVTSIQRVAGQCDSDSDSDAMRRAGYGSLIIELAWNVVGRPTFYKPSSMQSRSLPIAYNPGPRVRSPRALLWPAIRTRNTRCFQLQLG